MHKVLSVFKKLKKKQVIITLIIVVAIASFLFIRSHSNKQPFEIFNVTTITITEEVSATGKVIPEEKADLGFEKSGTVSGIYKKIGDQVFRGEILASLRDETTYASLFSAKAGLSVALANLADEESDSGIDYSASQKSAIDNARSAYITVSDTIADNADSFFNNSQSKNPTFIINEDYVIKQDVEIKRIKVSEALAKWKSDTDIPTSTDKAPVLLDNANLYLRDVKEFAATLSSIILNISAKASLPQSTIDSYLPKINSLNADINTSASLITSAKNNLAQTMPKSVAALQAKVEQARADVANYEAQYAKSLIYAPFNGVITKIEPSVGDIVSSGQVYISIMADKAFKIEVNVPEADIAKIKIDNQAKVTLDAYGDNVVFAAKVSAIDPAETVIEGVSTYKVTLLFDTADSRIRSGMTANIDILTNKKPGVLAIPYRAVMNSSETKSVRRVNKDGKTFEIVSVDLGLKGSDGLVEITSGLASGDTIVTYIKK